MANLNDRLYDAMVQMQRYGGEPKEIVVELVELAEDLNDDMQHGRELESIKRRIIEKVGVAWQPMNTAPRDGRWVCLKPKLSGGFWYSCPSVLQWYTLSGETGWWVEEGGVFPDECFVGWSPVPDDGDRP